MNYTIEYISPKIFAQLEQWLAEHPQTQYFALAYSGGLDSQVLLHHLVKFREQRPSIQIFTIHINHHLNIQSNEWEQFVNEQAQQWNVPIHTISIDIALQTGESVEAKARLLRYAALKKFVNESVCLVTAHHQDDQAETLLQQLFRGSGVAGLSAMPRVMPFSDGYLFRPMLTLTREEILTYAQHHQLKWIEDDSNLNIKFDRNFIRHQVIPLLRSRWPSITATIARSAQHCATAHEFIKEMLNDELSSCMNLSNNTLIISKLITYSCEHQINLIRHWLHYLGYRAPNTKKMQTLMHSLFHARPDSLPRVTWEGKLVTRYRDEIYAMKPEEFNLSTHSENTMFNWNWAQQDELSLNAQGRLQWVAADEGLSLIRLPAPLTVRFRQKGDHLKKKFQELNIPPWLRWRIPLIYYEDELIAVPHYWYAPRWQAQDAEAAVQIQWIKE